MVGAQYDPSVWKAVCQSYAEDTVVYFLSQDIQNFLCVHREFLSHSMMNTSVKWFHVVLAV